MKLGLREHEAADAIGSRTLLREMVASGWLKPVVQRHKLTLFDSADLSKAWGRIRNGETPTKS